jgi:hypothetical protein
MDIDISKVMTYEIKKELADRYFGFRKLIEEDKKELARAIHQQSISTEQSIVIDLARIYTMLKKQELIESFLQVSGLGDAIFYDEYMISSSTIRARVFAGVKARGLTRKGRFKNLFLGCYEMLVYHVDAYREKLGKLLEDRELIKEEIEVFYRKNDIDSILGFLRSLDDPGDQGLAMPPQKFATGGLKSKMAVAPPDPVEKSLAIFPPLVPLPQIKSQLKKLAEQALMNHPDGFELNI